jgi:hypothetical protein
MHVVIEQPIDLIRGIADQLDYNFSLSLRIVVMETFKIYSNPEFSELAIDT